MIAIALNAALRSGRLALLVLAPAFVLQAPRLEQRPRLSLLVAAVLFAAAAGSLAVGIGVRGRRRATHSTIRLPSARWRHLV